MNTVISWRRISAKPPHGTDVKADLQIKLFLQHTDFVFSSGVSFFAPNTLVAAEVNVLTDEVLHLLTFLSDLCISQALSLHYNRRKTRFYQGGIDFLPKIVYNNIEQHISKA